MLNELLNGVSRLCWLFPPLRPCVHYSEVLSQKEIALFVAFVNGHVKCILNDCRDSKEQEHKISLLLNSSTGLSRICHNDVVFIETLLAAASARDDVVSSQRDLVLFLRNHRNLWWLLHDAYEKIVKNNLINTCPLAVSSTPLVERLLPGVHGFQEFHKLFHESIHCVLEGNGICFHDEELDEGLVVYLHQQVMGKNACSFHYVGDKGEKYLAFAARFEKMFSRYPRSALVPLLKEKGVEELKAL